MTTMISENPLSRESADQLAARLAHRTHQTWYTLFDNGCYHVADAIDQSVYWPDAATVAEFAPDVIGAVNWSDRPDCETPIEPPPDDDPGSEGDIEGIPQGASALAIQALTKAQRGVFGDGETRVLISNALAALHAEQAMVERVIAETMGAIVARGAADVCRHCGGAHSIQKCLDLLALADIPPVRLEWCARDTERVMPPYAMMVA